DVALPELGRVEPVLRDEVAGGLDALMLAAGGTWLACAGGAVEAYPHLFKLDGLKQAPKGGAGGFSIWSRNKGNTRHSTLEVTYQRRGKGRRTARAVTLLPADQVRPWLEARLGPLVFCEIEGLEAKCVA